MRRHELIYRKAEFIDQFVDSYKRIRKRSTFPHKEVAVIVRFLFPGSSYAGRGAFATVHKVSSRARDLVLKTSVPKKTRNDERAYRRIPENIRNRYFAKVYWRTKYCLLQKYGEEADVPAAKLAQLKAIGKKFGLSDIRPANVRKVDGLFKIVDATLRHAE